MDKNAVAIGTMKEVADNDEPPLLVAPFGDMKLALNAKPKVRRDLFPISKQSNDFRKKYYPKVSQTEWSTWKWQIANSITSITQLKTLFNYVVTQELEQINDQLPIRITPYYASLIDFSNPNDPIGLSVIPSPNELHRNYGEKKDPLCEEQHMPIPGLVHRYPDRVLLLSTDVCATYCRYCTRSHLVAKHTHDTGMHTWQKSIDYIKEHPEVRDVLISGGDFLTFNDRQIEFLLSSLRQIQHVEIIRIGTKIPVVLPQRITSSLLKILKKYHPLLFSIHFTHPTELTQEVKQACERLSNVGIPLGSQTVLLKGVNDKPEIMKELFQKLLTFRVRPYYLYQCDPIPGSEHFRTPVATGLSIIENLRGHTSGYAVPHYVIDAPGGGGKIPLLPDYFVGNDNGDVVLRNYENKKYRYPDIKD